VNFKIESHGTLNIEVTDILMLNIFAFVTKSRIILGFEIELSQNGELWSTLDGTKYWHFPPDYFGGTKFPP
jgi:hypothetical protein